MKSFIAIPVQKKNNKSKYDMIKRAILLFWFNEVSFEKYVTVAFSNCENFSVCNSSNQFCYGTNWRRGKINQKKKQALCMESAARYVAQAVTQIIQHMD